MFHHGLTLLPRRKEVQINFGVQSISGPGSDLGHAHGRRIDRQARIKFDLPSRPPRGRQVLTCTDYSPAYWKFYSMRFRQVSAVVSVSLRQEGRTVTSIVATLIPSVRTQLQAAFTDSSGPDRPLPKISFTDLYIVQFT